MRSDRLTLGLAAALICGWFLRVLIEVGGELVRSMGTLIGVVCLLLLVAWVRRGEKS